MGIGLAMKEGPLAVARAPGRARAMLLAALFVQHALHILIALLIGRWALYIQVPLFGTSKF